MTKPDMQDFASRFPLPNAIVQADWNPRAGELRQYDEMFFDPALDGFNNELEYIAPMPFRRSLDVKHSPLGVGFELLDHRTGYDVDQVFPIMKNSGVKWARLQSGWQRAETEPGKYDFAWLDHIVDNLLKIGIQPWFSLSFGNGLYMNTDPIPPHNNYLFSPTVFGEACISAWEKYCKAMVTHFQNRVQHWEVWNEPNAGLRKPGMGSKIVAEPPSEYAKLTAITADAVRSVQKDAKIIAGAISGCAICNEYIKGLFDAGIAKYIDIFSYHPYNIIPELYFPDRLQYIRDLIEKSGYKIEIWQGENGRSTDSAFLKNGWKCTEGGQARYLTRRYLTDLRLGIPMTSYFLACDIGNNYMPGRLCCHGVISAADPIHYRPKLSFRAMQSFAWLFDSNTQPMHGCFEIFPGVPWGATTRSLDSVSGLTCAFRRGNIPIFAYYHVTHIDADWDVRPVQIQTWLDDEFVFEKPVLIDPIMAKIYRIRNRTDYCDGNYGSVILFNRMPLLDYPLFVTDASLFNGI